jgi:carbamoyl-phosphate synthase large subunit
VKRTILVSAASGIVGYGILRSLRKCADQCKLIGTSIYDFSIAPAFCDIFEKAVPTSDPGYTDWLCWVIDKHSVDMIIPGHECDMFQWNVEREKILSTGAFPLLNHSGLINLCRDKWAFYQRLIVNNAKYAIPTVISGDFRTFSVPFLLKPRRGYGSKGIVVINSEDEYEIHKNRLGRELMMQPIIGSPDEEYTVSAFFNEASYLIDYFPLKRKLSNDGFTLAAQVVDVDYDRLLFDLAKEFKPIGPTNFQFRVDGEETKLLEINPRISSATSIRASFGYNEAVMSIDYFLNRRLPSRIDKSRLKDKRAIRYYEDYLFL